jgi:protoporphyrinogen oxidase
MESLIDSVGQDNIKTGTQVTDIKFKDESTSGLITTNGSNIKEYDIDSVVIATMPNVLENLVGYSCEIEFQGTICSVISMSKSLLDTYWLNIADEAPFGALIEHTNFVPPSRYGGEHLLYAARYIQSPDEDIWQQNDKEVHREWLNGISDLFNDFDRSYINWIKTSRNPRTAPIYERGYLDMVVPYDLSDQVAEGVYYAGMGSRAQYPERSLNGGIVAGYECADRISSNLHSYSNS